MYVCEADGWGSTTYTLLSTDRRHVGSVVCRRRPALCLFHRLFIADREMFSAAAATAASDSFIVNQQTAAQLLWTSFTRWFIPLFDYKWYKTGKLVSNNSAVAVSSLINIDRFCCVNHVLDADGGEIQQCQEWFHFHVSATSTYLC